MKTRVCCHGVLRFGMDCGLVDWTLDFWTTTKKNCNLLCFVVVVIVVVAFLGGVGVVVFLLVLLFLCLHFFLQDWLPVNFFGMCFSFSLLMEG